MNYKGKAVGNETSVANEKLEPFDAEAGSEVGKNIANIKVYDTKDLLIEQTGLAPFYFKQRCMIIQICIIQLIFR